jgi:hypothetical protein
MLRQLLFWAMVGPKHVRRFLLLWLVLMGVFVYAFVHESVDSSTKQALPISTPAPRVSNR